MSKGALVGGSNGRFILVLIAVVFLCSIAVTIIPELWKKPIEKMGDQQSIFEKKDEEIKTLKNKNSVLNSALDNRDAKIKALYKKNSCCEKNLKEMIKQKDCTGLFPCTNLSSCN